MKIGIFGNTNNYLYILALGLRELGHTVHLVVNRKESLHRPESRHPELTHNYPSWILDCSDIEEEEFVVAGANISEVLEFLCQNSDGLIMNDIGPSLLKYCELPAIALMTGSDLTYYANYNTLDTREGSWSDVFKNSASGKLFHYNWYEFIERQRAGLSAAIAVSAALPGLIPEYDKLSAEIDIPDERRIFIYLSNTLELIPKQHVETETLRIFYGSRLNWKYPLPPGFISIDFKGTDIFLHGFAEYLHQGGIAEIIMYQKGMNLAETETLAFQLGIQDKIKWKGESRLNKFYDEMLQADVVVEQLSSLFPGMVALDAMALGIPVVTNFHPVIMEAHFSEPIPLCRAESAQEVTQQLFALSESKARQDIGTAGRRFAEKHLSPTANAELCVRRLDSIRYGILDSEGASSIGGRMD